MINTMKKILDFFTHWIVMRLVGMILLIWAGIKAGKIVTPELLGYLLVIYVGWQLLDTEDTDSKSK